MCAEQFKHLEYAVHQILPPHVEIWLESAKSIDASPSRCPHKPDERFFLPRPDLFTGVNSEEKTVDYLKNWLCVRGVAFTAAQTENPPALSHQAWRVMIGSCTLTPRTTETGTHAWRHRKQNDEVRGLVERASRDVEASITASPTWYDESIDGKSKEEKIEVGMRLGPEIIWEVNELAFRMELATLNARHTRIADLAEQYEAVCTCFPLGNAPLHVIDVGQANQGLADLDWWKRARFVYALWGVIKNWGVALPDTVWVEDKDFHVGFTQQQMASLEKALTGVYIDTFFITFGRPPLLPRQLTNPRSTDWIVAKYREMTPGSGGRWRPHSEIRGRPWYKKS